MKRYFLATAITIAATLSSFATRAADDAPQIQIAAGNSANDKMVIEAAPRRVVGEMIQRQFGTGLIEQLTVKQVNADGSYTMVDQLGRTWAYNADGNIVKGYGRATGTAMTYSPFHPIFQFPMGPGQKWQKTVSWQGGGWQGTYTVYTAVGGWETVSLTINGQMQSVTALRFNSEVTQSGSSSTKSTCLFAPAIKATVKCESADPAFTLTVTGRQIIDNDRATQTNSAQKQ